MENENKPTAGSQQGFTKPEDNSTQRTFTQEEVNQIVSERIKREQSKRLDNADNEYETRVKELDARENLLTCKEFVSNNSYPAELLDILDTSDSKKFIETAEKLDTIYSQRKPLRITTGVPSGDFTGESQEQRIAKAFKPNK